MPAPLNVDREAVRVLAVAVGVREAARQMGLPEATVQAWSARGNWGEKIEKSKAIAVNRVREREESRGRVQPIATVSPAEALSEAMENLSVETKLGFARASALVAKELSTADPSKLLDGKRAQAAKAWAQTAQIAHSWSGGAGTTVNVSVGLRLEMD